MATFTRKVKRALLEAPPAASSSSSSSSSSEQEEDTTPSKATNTAPMKEPDNGVTQQQQGAESEESESGDESEPKTPSASSNSSPEEDDTPTSKTPLPSSTKKPDAVDQLQEAESHESDSGSAADDESGEESEPEPDPEQEPATEPTPTPVKTARTRSSETYKAAAATAGTSIVVAVSATGEKKRPSDAERSPAKRVKEDAESGEKSEVKKKLFERRWSEDDEIALLEGFWDFTEKKGINPSKDMNAFHDFIKKELHFDVKLIQLKDKIGRLKKRFDNNLMNGKKGEDKTFSKPHEQKLFDLSKKIWGNDSRVQESGTRFSQRGKTKTSANLKSDLEMDTANGEDTDTANEEEDKVDKMEIVEVTRKSFEGMADFVVKRALDVVDGDKKAQLEEKWKELHVKEMEVFLKRIELVEEHAKLALAFYKGQGN